MKKFSLIILIIVIGIASLIANKSIDKWQYRNSFKNVHLTQISHQNFDMGKNQHPFWISVMTQDELYAVEKNYNLELPEIEFEKMLILSFGSKLESLKYNTKEPCYKTRKKYIGFSSFEREDPINIVYVYMTEKIPLMDTDVAGYPPDYKGKY